MPYGNFSTPVTAYTKTIHTSRFSSGSLVLDPSGYERFTNYSNPSVFRTGSNTTDYHVPKTIFDIPYYELQSYKKVIGFTDRVRKEYYYEKDKLNPNVSVRHSRKVKYKKKVFGYGIRWRRKKLVGQQPTDLLLKPNPLTYVLLEKYCNTKEVFLRQKLTDGAGGVFYDNAIQFVGFPSECAARSSSGFVQYSFNGIPDEPDWLPFPPAVGLPPNLADDCLAKLYSKVSDEFPDYITDVIQVKSSWKTITKIVKTAIEVVYAMKRLDLKRLKGTLPGITPKEISSLWLEFIYGVTPVLDDLDKSIDLFTRQARRWRTYSTSKREIVSSKSSGSLGFSTRPIYTYNETVKTVYTIRYGCIMTGDMSFIRKVRQDNSMISAFSTAWEIIPYSFCIDWIYNLGDYLKASDALDDYLLYQWRTILIDQTVTREYKVNSYPENNIENSGDPFTLYGRRLTVVRDPTITLPSMPVPRAKTVDQIFSFRRSLNALALFVQVVSRK